MTDTRRRTGMDKIRAELHKALDKGLDQIIANDHTGLVGLWLECRRGGIAGHSWATDKGRTLLIIPDDSRE